MPKQKMKRVDLVKQDSGWVGKTQSGEQFSGGKTKAAALQDTARRARRDPEAITVKIHGVDGKIQSERTYPRAADPRSSRG